MTVAAAVPFATLVWSGLSHVRHRKEFGDAVRQHAIFPKAVVSAVVNTVIVDELLLGSLGVGGLLISPNGMALRYLLLIAGATLILFGLYATYLFRYRPHVPCGCSSASDAVNVWTVVRAGVLAAAALGAAASTSVELLPLMAFNASAPLIALASLAFSSIVWIAPDALRDPMDDEIVRRLVDSV